MIDENRSNTDAAKAQIELSRDVFLRDLIRELAGSLEDIIGLKGAAGYISLVGQNMGEKINSSYRNALSVERLNRSQVCDVLVDLKRRIEGKFYVIEENDERIVLGNHACPFGDKVIGRPSMCMMTSNVFGHIASQNLGYAKVELQETIAKGHQGCRVVIYLKQSRESDAVAGREYVEN